jgi:L-lactate dehydrogenase complex protein LldG
VRDDVVRQTSTGEGAAEALHARFMQSATRAGCEVARLAAADAPAHIAAWLAAHGAATAWLDPGLPASIGDALRAVGVAVTHDAGGDALFRVAAAVTGVELAVAETGSLVCTAGPHTARGASLIAPLHVAVVRAPQLAPDLCDVFARFNSAAALPAHLTLITGPSKTADVEGVLVTGVHGPGVVHVVLVEPPA